MRNIKEVFINGVSLEEILDKHEKWVKHEEDGEKAKLIKADLSFVDLRGADLINVDLRFSNLRGANLSCANLVRANLSHTDLRKADLSYTNLSGADLSYTNLSEVDLNDSDLKNTNLKHADLAKSNLRNTTLYYANLNHAQLTDADLTSADLSYANLMGANLKDAILDIVRYNEGTSFFALQCPEKGSFIGYKKSRGKIVELLITEDSKRSNATTRKCRCSKAKVLSITNIGNTKEYDKVASDYNKNFIYRVGEIVEVEDFDEDRWEECSTGIHFFLTRDEAVRY